MIAEFDLGGSAEHLGRMLRVAEPALKVLACETHGKTDFSVRVAVYEDTSAAVVIFMGCCRNLADMVEVVLRNSRVGQ